MTSPGIDPDTRSELPLHDLDTGSVGSGADGAAVQYPIDRGPCGDCGRDLWFGMHYMTHHRGPIYNLGTHLAMRSQDGECDGTLARLREAGLDPGGATSLHELASSCMGTVNRERAEQILTALVSLAVDDELAAIGALVALTRALVRLSRRLIVAGIDFRQADIDVIDAAYEQIVAANRRMATRDRPDRHLARTIIGKSWDRLRWDLEAEQRCALRRCRLDANGEPVAHPEDDPGPSPITWILTEAVSEGAISSEAARIIHATRVEGRSFRSLACELHKGEAALRKCRQRSEQALVDRHQSNGRPPRTGGDGARSQEVG